MPVTEFAKIKQMTKEWRIRAFIPEDYDEILALWHESGLTIKASDTLPEIKKLLALPSNVFLIADSDSGVFGTVIGAWDGRRAWIYHLAVKPFARPCKLRAALEPDPRSPYRTSLLSSATYAASGRSRRW
jgi:hypothetical protein